jgi:pimeloyl-ACP methyl ester carboxylesterase
MSYISARDGTRLWVEETGTGSPILFVHEFADDHREWKPQINFFSRRHRCITYTARGYAPSDIPPAEGYSQSIAVTDAIDVLDSLNIESGAGYGAVKEG